MKSSDHEQAVLNAIENQFRTENPQLMADFTAFNSGAPPIKPLHGWHWATPHEKRRRMDSKRFWFALEVIAMACALVAVLAGITVWLLTTLSQ
jgi:hypothetical protein